MDKPVNKEDAQGESGSIGGFDIERTAEWSPGHPTRSDVETLATHVATSLRLGDIDYRPYRLGFEIKELVSPAKARQKKLEEQEQGKPSQQGSRLTFDGGPQTPLKRQAKEECESIIPDRQEGIPCATGNWNPRNEGILCRWEKPVGERALAEWKKLGYENPKQMEQCIKETLQCARNEAPEAAWSYRKNWQHDGAYPLEKGGKFEPVEIEECRRIINSGAPTDNRLVQFQSNQTWFKDTQLGPNRNRDDNNRKLLTYYFQPQGSHTCRTMLFSKCWQCWRTRCGTCYYMYCNGAQRWGPGACDRCPSLTQYAILEENYMFKVIWGTNEEGGWSKPQSIKWALVYDLRHEGWGETYMEKPLFLPQYDDISDAEEDLGGRPGIPVYKPDHPGLEFTVPTETAEQTQARRRSERLSQVAPPTYKEGRSNERRRSASVPTRPKHGGGAAETPIQPGATSEEEGFTLLNKQGTEEEEVFNSAAANILMAHPEFSDLLGGFQSQGVIPAHGSYDGEGNPMEWDCGPIDWAGLCEEEFKEREEREATLQDILDSLPPLGSHLGCNEKNAQDSNGVPLVAAATGAEAGGAQLSGGPLQDTQKHPQMVHLEAEGPSHQDGSEVDEEAASTPGVADPPHESSMGEDGALSGHTGGHAGKEEPGGGAAGLDNLLVEVCSAADKPKISKAAKRKLRAKAGKWARFNPLPMPDTHFQLHGRGLSGTKRKYREDSPYPRGNRRRSEHPKPQPEAKRGYYTEEYRMRK